jgi:hypothetical protein
MGAHTPGQDTLNMAGADRGVNRTQIYLGILALVLGVVLYLLDRPSAQTYFVPEALSLYQGGSKVFGVLGNYLPTFVHAFAFALISNGVLNKNLKTALGVCAFWALVDGAFELGQHPAIAPHITALIPAWFSHLPLLENTRGYFQFGRFDPLDLLSIAVGATLAYAVIVFTQGKEGPDTNTG